MVGGKGWIDFDGFPLTGPSPKLDELPETTFPSLGKLSHVRAKAAQLLLSLRARDTDPAPRDPTAPHVRPRHVS